MKAFCALAVVVPLWPCLAEECSDIVGSCATKPASLMQFKSLSQKKQALSLETHSGFSSKLAGFQKFTDEMIKKYGQAPAEAPAATDFGADVTMENPDGDLSGAATGRSNSTSEVPEDVRIAVRTMLKFILTMSDELETYHVMDKDEAIACSDVTISASCQEVHMSGEIITNILDGQTFATQEQEKHRKCREEAAAADLCSGFCASNGPCNLYDYARDARNYDGPDPFTDPSNPEETQIRSIPECVAGNDNEDSAFVDGNIQADEGTSELKVMEDCLVETHDWLDYLYPKFENCRNQEAACENKVDECDELQTGFQNAQCLFAMASNGNCKQLADCKRNKENKCSDTCDKIQIRSGARAADNETGQRLVCLLHALFGLPDMTDGAAESAFIPGSRPDASSIPKALTHCKDTNIDTTYWEIACPSDVDSNHVLGNPDDDKQYICPTENVLAPCDEKGEGVQESFVKYFYQNENEGFAISIPAPLHCSEKASRGANKVVTDCAVASTCLTES